MDHGRKNDVPNSSKRALNYNDKRSKRGPLNASTLIIFSKDVEQLNYYEKLKRFEGLIALKKRASTNCSYLSQFRIKGRHRKGKIG